MADYKQRGIELDPSVPSPFDLPDNVIVQAADPEEEPAAEDTADEEPLPESELFSMDELDNLTGEGKGKEDTGEEEPPEEDDKETKSEEEMVEEKETSPPAEWKKYLQPILRDVEINLKVPIELRNSYTVGFDGDPDLGFHIVGTVFFPEGIPEDMEDVLGGQPLRYKAYVSPDGVLSNHVELVYPTAYAPYQPVYRHNPNVFSG
jgi:hypothetical protein